MSGQGLTVWRANDEQVRECATALLHVAKGQGIPMFLVGHVTKTGDIAGDPPPLAQRAGLPITLANRCHMPLLGTELV